MSTIILTNDDGYQAQGIRVLYNTLKENYKTVIVAPDSERSTTGHSLSLDRPLRLQQHHEDIYSCDGFPADTVLLSLGHLYKQNKPKMIISGINFGANLGQDLFYSGTMAAARESCFHGVPAISISLVLKQIKEPYYFETASKLIKKLINKGIDKVIPKNTFLNINVPNLPDKDIQQVSWSTLGHRSYSEEIHERTDSRGRKYYWIAGVLLDQDHHQGSECLVVDQKSIAVTPHILGPVDESKLSALKEFIKGVSL